MGLGSLGHRLYSGESSINFVGRRKMWYLISAVILIVAIAALLVRGLNLGIEFRGGAEFRIPSPTCSVEQARSTASEVNKGDKIGPKILPCQSRKPNPVSGLSGIYPRI